jgi:hypothetical protein
LRKHTGYVDAWPIFCPLMFWNGIDNDTESDLKTKTPEIFAQGVSR